MLILQLVCQSVKNGELANEKVREWYKQSVLMQLSAYSIILPGEIAHKKLENAISRVCSCSY